MRGIIRRSSTSVAVADVAASPSYADAVSTNRCDFDALFARRLEGPGGGGGASRRAAWRPGKGKVASASKVFEKFFTFAHSRCVETGTIDGTQCGLRPGHVRS